MDCDYTGPRIDEEGCTDKEDEVEPYPVAISFMEESRSNGNTRKIALELRFNQAATASI